MSTPEDPASTDHRREVLEEHRDIFETIREGEDISPEFRRKYGQQPLDLLATLQEASDD